MIVISKAVFSNESEEAQVLYIEFDVMKTDGTLDFKISFDYEKGTVKSTGTKMSAAPQLTELLETYKDSKRKDNIWPNCQRSTIRKNAEGVVVRCSEWYI